MYTTILQIVISLALITVIILQSKANSGLGGTFGESNYHTKRGVEKTLFYTTIGLSVTFVILAIVNSL